MASTFGKPTIDEIQSYLKDPLVSDNFLFTVPNPPPINMGGLDVTIPLKVLCQEATKPGMEIQQVDIQLFGHTLVYGGNLTYSHDFDITFVNIYNQITFI